MGNKLQLTLIRVVYEQYMGCDVRTWFCRRDPMRDYSLPLARSQDCTLEALNIFSYHFLSVP